MRPDFRPRGIRLGCIAKDVRAFRFENSESSSADFRGYTGWLPFQEAAQTDDQGDDYV